MVRPSWSFGETTDPDADGPVWWAVGNTSGKETLGESASGEGCEDLRQGETLRGGHPSLEKGAQ